MDLKKLVSRMHATCISDSEFGEKYFNNKAPLEVLQLDSIIAFKPFENVKGKARRRPSNSIKVDKSQKSVVTAKLKANTVQSKQKTNSCSNFQGKGQNKTLQSLACVPKDLKLDNKSKDVASNKQMKVSKATEKEASTESCSRKKQSVVTFSNNSTLNKAAEKNLAVNEKGLKKKRTFIPKSKEKKSQQANKANQPALINTHQLGTTSTNLKQKPVPISRIKQPPINNGKVDGVLVQSYNNLNTKNVKKEKNQEPHCKNAKSVGTQTDTSLEMWSGITLIQPPSWDQNSINVNKFLMECMIHNNLMTNKI